MKKIKINFTIIQFKLFLNSVENQIPWKKFPKFSKIESSNQVVNKLRSLRFHPKARSGTGRTQKLMKNPGGKMELDSSSSKIFRLAEENHGSNVNFAFQMFREVFILFKEPNNMETQICRQQNCYVFISTFNKKLIFFCFSLGNW